MSVKKLSIKKGKKGKLAIHKEEPVEEEQEELDLEDDDTPFEPDEPPVKLKVGKTGKPLVGKVSTKEKNLPEDAYEVDVEGEESVEPTGQPMANVGYSIDRTINLGNYESLKVHVSLHVPSEVDEEEIEGNYVYCKGWVENKMDEVAAEYVAEDD